MPNPGLSGVSDNNRPLAAYEKPGYDLCRHVDRFIDTGAGPVPVIRRDLDKWTGCPPLRSGVDPAPPVHGGPRLYAIGSPDDASEVLVTANFKLTLIT